MSDYKRYFIRQMGLDESLKSAGIQPSNVDPKELEMGVEDEKDHTSDPNTAKTIALQHLAKKPDYYSRMKKAGLEEDDHIDVRPEPSRMLSPSAVATPVIAMAVRGSSTGGLPSGADREMSLPQTDGVDVSKLSPSQLGGYEPIATAKDNSKLIGKTPNNPQINSSTLKVDSPDTQLDPHPFQFQKAQGEPPQDVTGASTDSDDSLTLKMTMPKGIDVDIQEDDEKDGYDEYEHGSDEENHRDNPEFQRKSAEVFRKSRSASPVGDEIRKSMGINETFARHLKLMNETIKARNLAECDCGPDCDCDGCKAHNKTTKPEKVEEKYSAPFAKMRGLANLGERRVSKNGLWESSHKPGENFTTHWKMDKEKAGMVKIDEKKLLSVKENLSKKTTLTEKESAVLKKIEEVLQKRMAK